MLWGDVSLLIQMRIQTAQILCISVLVCLFAGCGGGDNGVTPPVNTLRITSITPNSMALGGRSVPVTIGGTGFSGAVTVDLGLGIEIVTKEVTDSQTIQITANVSLSAPTGAHAVVIASGSDSARLDSGLMISDNRAPVARFIVNPTQGTINSIYELDATGSSDEDGTITSYRWQISDGTNPQGRRVEKNFESKGTYTIRLTVTDNQGGISSSIQEVEVGDNLPPVASFTATPGSGTQLTDFVFDASGSVDPDGEIRTYSWDFGGPTDNGKIATHRFKDGGSYIVELQVKDSKGAFSFDRRTIRVEFFDKEKAIQEIQEVAVDFLRQFAKLDVLPAEDIVRGFSKNPGCRGRGRELEIINSEKSLVRTSGLDILGEPVVTSVNDQNAKANITARFYGTLNDGTDYGGVATHYLTMINENGTWAICDFMVLRDAATNNLPAFLFQ